MKKLSDCWKQKKRNGLSSQDKSQQHSPYQPRESFNGENDDDEFLNAVNELEERESTTSIENKQSRRQEFIRRKVMDTTSIDTARDSEIATDDNLQLSLLNLPALVLQQYARCGITRMFEWQAECLKMNGVLNRGNLVYSAPTSAGKTLVAEVLMLKTVLECKKKALMILPFVSVTREKVYYLQKLFACSGVRVDGFMGNHAPPGGFDAIDMAVCTIEKANGLINKLIESNTLNNLGIVVVDELHMIGDPHRGFLLELLLTKLLYLQKKSSNILESSSDHQPIQIIGMSATLPNLKLLADWLNAVLYCTDFRPVPLAEKLKIGNVIYCAKTLKPVQHLSTSCIEGDCDHICQICIESIASNQGILIFCPTKAWCERLAESIARSVNDLGREHRLNSQNQHGLSHLRDSLRNNLNLQDITDVFDHLRKSSAGLDLVLAKTVAVGVAFHHAGLTFDEREIIEGAFRRGVIKVLTATSTLSSGVNLPARRVIVRTPIFNGSLINILSYRQMVGRAGRTGLDSEGESILICKENERGRAEALITNDLPPVKSCLQITGQTVSSSFKRALLEVVVSGAATNEVEAVQYASCTLLEASLRDDDTDVKSLDTIRNCLKFLIENEFIKEVLNANGEKTFTSTPLGRAVLASSLSPDEGLIVYQELERARRCFVLENDLHVIYQVTPLNVSDQWPAIDWLHYSKLWEQLSLDKKRVAECVGIEERFIVLAMKGINSNNQRRTRLLRFYSAMALYDLVNEMPLSEVALKYNCNRGTLQSLQQSASTFAGMVTIFCHHLGWTMMELVLANFQNRLYFGVQQELCDLVRINFLTAHLARGLYNSGIKTVAGLALAKESQVMSVLSKLVPFESHKQKDIESSFEVRKRVRNNSVWLQGREPMSDSEAATTLISEARKLLREEFGCDVNFNLNGHLKEPFLNGAKNMPNNAIDENSDNLILESLDVNEVESKEDAQDISDDCSLNLQDLESAQIFDEENFDLPDSESDLFFSNTVEKTNVETSDRQFLYLSSDSNEPQYEICSPKAESKDDTNESVSLFPELEAEKAKIAKELCSDSIIQKLLDDSSFSLTDSINKAQSFIKVDKNNVDNEEEESQELFNSPLAKSSPFILNTKSVHERETERGPIKRLKRNKNFTKFNLYTHCEAKSCDCDIEIFEVTNLSDFVEVWSRQSYYSLAFSCVNVNNNTSNAGNEKIGFGLTNGNNPGPSTSKSVNIFEIVPLLGCEVDVIGVAISWDVHYVFYVDFKSFDMQNLKTMMKSGFTSDETQQIVGYSLKEQLKVMLNIFECLPQNNVTYCDPKVACWLLDQDIVLNFVQIIERVLPMKLHLVKDFPQNLMNVGSGMNLACGRSSARLRASREADLIHQLVLEFRKKLDDVNLLKSFEEIEMCCLHSFVLLESNGIGINVDKMKQFAKVLKEKMSQLATIAFEIAGHEFNLASPIDVAKVLYHELKIGFINEENEIDSKLINNKKSVLKGTSSSLRRQLKRRGCISSLKTNKDTLAKLKDQHILPAIILSWRKLQSALSKNVNPILNKKTFVPSLLMYRVMSSCENLTATGRVTLFEPDVQMIPRDFIVEIPHDEDIAVNLRNAFIPFDGGVFVGADYSQLELRILAELSQDASLKSALNNDQDVFKSIAAQWKNCDLESVTVEDRQHAKQICYGMIYGIGAKSLGDQLEVDPDEALQFMEEFKTRYPDVRSFINSTVEKCRQLGYIETLSGRRRYLKDISSHVLSVKMHGERQAVNSTIQGSAADIFKKALIAVESDFDSVFLRQAGFQSQKGVPRLVLQLHDEVIYECDKRNATKAAKILKYNMENSTKLSVILPVKVKMGTSWGEMKYINL